MLLLTVYYYLLFQVRQHLSETYPNKWIGRGSPVTWPPRSPDLTPLDFFLWGHIKEQVYTVTPVDIEDLKLKITNAFQTVTPEMLRNVSAEFHRRILFCRERNGEHIEHL